MTFSIVARSEDATTWGVAVASKFLAVGPTVAAARAGVGAVATQAMPNLSYKPRGLDLMSRGSSAQEALDELVDGDDRAAERQAGLVDAAGRAATYTGAQCLDWAGGVTGPGFAAQGNILAGPQVVEALVAEWTASQEPDFARRLVAALLAADRAGGDRRGRQSAALLVVREGAGYGFDDVAVDLRVDDHPDPVAELGRILAIHELLHREPPEEDRLPLTEQLRAELETLAHARGCVDLDAWIGTENYEMRISEDYVDRRVVELLRGGATT
jgi:uncharacterized Ntn-hydrolase superfamily protein